MLAKRLTAMGGLGLALILLMLGSNVEYGEGAYFFPNLLAYFLLGFAIILLISDADLLGWLKESADFMWRWMFGIVGEGNPSRWPDIVRLIPMFIIIFCYLYFADIVGLYTTSFLSFLLITVIYTPQRPRSRSVIKNVFISVVFTGVIYLIFSVLLQLQTPTAWLM
jgi:hypothetical protein